MTDMTKPRTSRDYQDWWAEEQKIRMISKEGFGTALVHKLFKQPLEPSDLAGIFDHDHIKHLVPEGGKTLRNAVRRRIKRAEEKGETDTWEYRMDKHFIFLWGDEIEE